MLPDFNRLRVFFHVHEARSVSAAAEALHVTQSAVSQSLAKLEDELKAQLFVRRHRAVVPTAAGEALFAVVAPFVAGLQERVGQIHRARHELAGTLQIGAPVEFGRTACRRCWRRSPASTRGALLAAPRAPVGDRAAARGGSP
ncbi:LysR family transcriptional regulator [Nannocystis pusilla]|uniref:LysR family transcriptional regulator n=1 Tax=Nannocystis pusilla TaxID=889268 RepID=UPI003B77CE02